MLKEILQSIEGVTIYPIIALILFGISFVLAVVAVWRMSPGEVDYCSRLPLSDSAPTGSKSRRDEGFRDSGDK
jgi:hypothetical protein